MLNADGNRVISLTLAWLSLGLGVSACGQIHLGSATPNDTEPTGTIIAQGPFVGASSKTVTGTAVIYKVDLGSYIIRLNGISTPSETGLQVVGVTNEGKLAGQTLRSTSGNQNYSVSTETTPQWLQVNIYSTLNTTNYGTAILVTTAATFRSDILQVP